MAKMLLYGQRLGARPNRFEGLKREAS